MKPLFTPTDNPCPHPWLGAIGVIIAAAIFCLLAYLLIVGAATTLDFHYLPDTLTA